MTHSPGGNGILLSLFEAANGKSVLSIWFAALNPFRNLRGRTQKLGFDFPKTEKKRVARKAICAKKKLWPAATLKAAFASTRFFGLE